MKSILLPVCLLWLAKAAAQELPAGKGSFVFQDEAWNANRPITVWYYRPAAASNASEVLFVLHGVNRDASRYLDDWTEIARRHRAVLLCPEFGHADFPEDTHYNLGNIFRTISADETTSAPQPESLWSYSLLDPLFDRVVARLGLRTSGYLLYGHSAGSQFVHRMCFFKPHARIKRAISANAGWYMLPDPGVAFPYGLKGTTCDEAAVRRAFATPLVLLLGEEDVNPDHPQLRKTPGAIRQGRTRLERGRRYFAAAKARAEQMHVPFAWKLVTVPGVAHSDRKMAPSAEIELFQPPDVPVRSIQPSPPDPHEMPLH